MINKIREILREGLKEKHTHEYGCVMVYLKINNNDWNKLLDEIDEKDVYINSDDDSFGLEKDPHVTILFGLHGTIKDNEIENDLNNISEPKITFNGVSCFDDNELYDVLKFDIISRDLVKLNKIFKKYPNTNTYDYHPHCTIAYLKKGKCKEYVKKLKDFGEISFDVDKIVYSKTNGDKKEYKIKK